MKIGTISRGSKFCFAIAIVAAFLISSSATFAGVSAVSPGQGGNNILPIPPVSGGGGGNHIDAERDWANTGTDFNTTTSWTGGVVPTTGDVAWFKVAEVTNPNLSSSLSIAGLYFNGTGSKGYDITSSSTAVKFTLTATGTVIGTEQGDTTAVAIGAENTSGANTIDAPIILGAAAASTQTIIQAAGGTLVINGVISEANAGIKLSLTGAGTVTLAGANTYTGGTTVISGTLQIGNNSALGTGTLTLGNTGVLTSTILAVGGPRTISNNVSLLVFTSSSAIIAGSNDLTINGSLTGTGLSRTLTVNNSGLTTLSNVFLTDSGSGLTLTINGTGSVTIGGVIANNSTNNTLADSLKYSGTGTLTLNGTNTYSGSTTLSSGTIVLGNKSAFGTGIVALGGVSISANTDLSGANAISNRTLLTGNNTFTGTSNSIELSGAVTANGDRTITNNMVGPILTFSGPVNLSDTSANRVLTFAGTGITIVSGSIANGDGGSPASSLRYSGTGTLTLSGANTYSGGTTISGSTLVASADGALGTGNVSLTASGVTLTLQNGASNNYIADSANLSIVTGSTVNLSFSGTPDTILMLIVDGTVQAAGLYGSAASGAPNVLPEFTGLGEFLVTAVPERSTWTMLVMGAALLVGVQRWRRRRTS